MRRAVLGVAMVVGCAAQPPSLPAGSIGGSDDSDGATDEGSADVTTAPGTITDPGDSGGGPACGNGAMDLDEDCDDGNAVEIDGCTSTCRIGPTGLAFGEFFETNMLTRGTGGGTLVTHDCPDGEMLVGFEAFWENASNKNLTGVIGLCAAPDLVDAHPTSVALTPTSPLPLLGTTGGGEFESLDCPSGSAISMAGIATGLIFATSVGASCRPLNVSGLGSAQVLVVGPSELLPVALQGQRLEALTECPVGEVAVGLHGRENEMTITGAGLRCRPIALAYP